jgi:transcriptional regulator with XRE-family HTH domain
MEEVMVNFEILGKRIQTGRESFGLTQEKLANITGLSRAYIGEIERGESKASIETLVRISDCLNLSLDYLIENDEVQTCENNEKLILDLISKCNNREKSAIYKIIKSFLSYKFNVHGD